MSLEDKIDALTAAVIALTETMQPKQAEASEKPAKAETKTTTKAAPKKEAPEPKAFVTFEDLKKAVVAAADKDKEATKAALAKFKVAKISELKEEQYEGALTALKAVVEGGTEEASFV